MSEIKTIIETLPLKSNTEQKNNHYIPVWEYAGEILKKYDLKRNGELQYALFKWLRKHNTQETGGLCEDGFFDYGQRKYIACVYHKHRTEQRKS